MPTPFSTLKCPVCESSFTLGERSLKCTSGHCFDQAKQGYFNLLQNQDKSSKSPGDTSDMVVARSRFLEAGHYTPLVAATTELIIAHAKQEIVRYTDIACGEGFYTEKFSQALSEQHYAPLVTAIDISTPAMRKSGKRLPQGACLVGNAFRLPIHAKSQDLATHMFCRPCPSETARILKDDAILIDVSAGPRHLIELREIIYTQINEKNNDADLAGPYDQYFDTLQSTQLDFGININQAEIADLITMTPHVWRAKPEHIEVLKSLKSLQLTCDFVLTVLRPSTSF